MPDLTVGHRIREARKRAGLTQPQLGEMCGWGKDSQSRISHYERGINVPTFSDVEKIASATCRTAAWIAFGDTSSPINVDKLTAAMERLESFLSRKKIEVSPATKAKLLAYLCDGQVDLLGDKDLLRLLQLAK